MKQVLVKRVALTLTGVALMTAASACSTPQDVPAPASSADLIGSWRGDCDATLQLGPNGHFTFTGLPSGDDLSLAHRVRGSGQWSLYRGGKDAPPPSLDVTYDAGTVPLFFDAASKDGKPTRLRLEADDENCLFTRD